MSVFDEVLEDSQQGYENKVSTIIDRLGRRFEDEVGHLPKDAFIGPLMDAIAASDAPAALKLVYAQDISQLAWWADVKLGDEGEGQLAALIRLAIGEAAAELPRVCADLQVEARWNHTILGGWFVNRMHSPTRGVFDYALALARDPRNQRIDVIHAGAYTPELQAFARERLGEHFERVRFISRDANPDFLVEAIDAGPSTFHVWCEGISDMHITLLSLFGPMVTFTCADAAPTQYADVFWYCHEAEYIRALWARRRAPARFIANYIQTQAVPFNHVEPVNRRGRATLGFAPDDVVITTVGNRLGVEMDQPFVDGIGGLLMNNPRLRWLVVGGLQDFWISAFRQVFAHRFAHVPHDMDLAGLFGATDIFANPFRAGGGNTAIIAIGAGVPVLTRGDIGDVGAFVPARHRADSAEHYFERLEELAADPALRAAWAVEQQTLQATRLNEQLFANELSGLCDLAMVRYARRSHLTLEDLLDLPPVRTVRAG